MSRRGRLGWNTIGVVLFALMAFPVFWMVSTAFKNNDQINSFAGKRRQPLAHSSGPWDMKIDLPPLFRSKQVSIFFVREDRKGALFVRDL